MQTLQGWHSFTAAGHADANILVLAVVFCSLDLLGAPGTNGKVRVAEG